MDTIQTEPAITQPPCFLIRSTYYYYYYYYYYYFSM